MDRSRKKIPDGVKALATNVARLSRLLTSERGSLPSAYLQDAGLREAYISYFLPPNIRKIGVPLRELSLHPDGLLAKEKLRILDIGSGPGTASLGGMGFFSERDKAPALEFTAVDQVAENLMAAEGLFSAQQKETGANASLTTIRSGIEGVERLFNERFDLIIFSNVLNELFLRDAGRIAKRIIMLNTVLDRLLAEDGSAIIIEPALRETAREMLEVRDGIVGRGYNVYSPCPAGGTCPALANPKDWCHEDVPWDPPELVKEIDALTGLRKDSLKFSYVVFRKDGRSLFDACGNNAFRVVSEPLVSKGKMEFYVCGRSGRRLVTRLDKDSTSGNRAFETLRRGAVVGFERIIDEGKRLRVGKETSVQDITPS